MTDTTAAASRRKAARAIPADVLADLKDDLGIPVDDTTNDEWLARRVAGLWARMESYTARILAYPPASFTDHWSGVVQNDAYKNAPPVLASPPRGSVFLRVFPVLGVTALDLNGATADPALVGFDPVSGKILSVDGTGYAADLGGSLLASDARIVYAAGFAELPADLYEILLGSIGPAWATRQAQGSGMGAGSGITEVNVQDVGSVQFGNANSFVDASTKRGSQGGVDPLLGPYTQTLDAYVDWRSMLGSSTYPATTRTPPPPLADR